jgi:hypothetical protein
MLITINVEHVGRWRKREEEKGGKEQEDGGKMEYNQIEEYGGRWKKLKKKEEN